MTIFNGTIGGLTAAAMQILSLNSQGVVVQKVTVPSYTYACTGDCGGPPDDIVKETWSCDGGNLIKKKVEHGRVLHKPASSETVWDIQ